MVFRLKRYISKEHSSCISRFSVSLTFSYSSTAPLRRGHLCKSGGIAPLIKRILPFSKITAPTSTTGLFGYLLLSQITF